MILNIFGGGGSGKTTLQFALLRLIGFTNLVPYTTRTKRTSEQNGIHYHFVTKKEFEKKELILKRHINNVSYGVLHQDLLATGMVVTTFDLVGISELENMGIDSKIIYLDIPESKRIYRMLERGDNYETVKHRVIIDRKQIQTPNTIFPILTICGGSVEEIIHKVLNFVK